MNEPEDTYTPSLESAELPTAALTMLNLKTAPYAAAADDRFFYGEPGVMHQLDLLAHLAEFSELLLLVEAPEGTGKSTLVRQFLLQSKDNWRCAALNGASLAGAESLLAALVGALQLGEGEPATLPQQLAELHRGGLIPILLIDDAGEVPIEALMHLLRLCGSAEQTLTELRIILLAEPGLQERLAQNGIGEPTVHRVELPPFREDQSAAYLLYRLAVAGYTGESPFSATEIRAIHKSADGRPGPLNLYANEALAEKAGRAPRVDQADSNLRTKLGRFPWLGALVLALVIAAIAAFRGPLRGLFEPAPDPPALVPLELPEQPAVHATEDKPTATTLESPAADDSRDTATQQDPHPAASPSADEAPEPAAEAPTTADTTAPEPAQVIEAPAGEEAAAPPPEETPPPAELETRETPPPEDSTAVAQPEPEPAPLVEEPPAEQPAPAAPTEAPAQPQPAAGAPTISSDHAWLAAQAGDRYTLQLLGVLDENSARNFAKRHNLGNKARVFRMLRDGKHWYVVVYGSYPDRDTARAAIATLASPLRTAGPWARSFASIQEQMR